MNLTNREMFDKDQVAEWRRKAEALDWLEEQFHEFHITSRTLTAWVKGHYQAYRRNGKESLLAAIEAARAAQGEG